MNKNALYLTFKIAALCGVLAEKFMANTADGFTVVCVLAFCCLFVAEYLVNRLCRGKGAHSVCPLLGIAGCFGCGAERFFPLLLIMIFELVELLDAGEYFYRIAAVTAALAALIIMPEHSALASAALLTAAGTFARMAVERVEYFRELSEKQRTTISAQNDRLSKLRAWSASVRETASLEERSRFSMRIHDKLGHGISGSIILLEGAKLNLKSNPEQAEKSLNTAIENLRGSVDSIREALREERPRREAANAAELRELLERFSLNYDIKTALSLEGDSGKITPAIWNCLKENLIEALTNTVKHSNAGEFTLKIRVYDKMIRAEFADNGNAPSFNSFTGSTKGMGLAGIEDRVTFCGGKCLFQCGAAGFRIINIFGVEL